MVIEHFKNQLSIVNFIHKYMTLQKLLIDFLEYLEVERNRSQKTIENYHHYLKRFLLWAKISEPRDITAQLVRNYRLYLNRLADEKGNELKKVPKIII